MTPAAGQTGPRISGLALIVPDYDLGIAFYRDVMGFRLIEDLDQGNKRWVTLEPSGGGAKIVIARADGARQSEAIGNQAGGRVWLFLQTDDFWRDHARMTAAGVFFEEEPRVEPYGTVAVWQDPWGNRWDLIASQVQIDTENQKVSIMDRHT